MAKKLKHTDGFGTSQLEVGVAYNDAVVISAANAHNKKIRAERAAADKRTKENRRLERESHLTLRSFK